MLEYEWARRRLDVGAALAEKAPRPVVVQTESGSGDGSALSTLLTAQLLPQVMNSGQSSRVSLGANSDNVSDAFDNAQGAVSAAAERQQQLSEEYQRRQESAMRQQFEKGEGYGQGRRR